MEKRMRQGLWRTMGMGVLVCCLSLAAVSAAQEGPKAVVTETSHDFGSVLEGNHMIHAFVMRNAGDAPLDIEAVRTG